MANMVRIELKKEYKAEIKHGNIYDMPSCGYEVYACCDELSCWIGNCTDVESLDEIISEEELISSIYESASEYELSCLISVLEHNNYKYDCFGITRTAEKVR